MSEYRHILFAAELNDNCDNHPAERAARLAKQFGAKLTLVHAVEQMASYGAAYGIAAAGADIEEILLENATKAMQELGQKLGVSETDQVIKLGPARLVILEEAERLGADLIIVGSHGRHGVRLLLGSTANAVLHGTKVDVLAVRIPE